MDAKQLACAHSSLILANNFAPVSEALCLRGYMRTILILLFSLSTLGCNDSDYDDEFFGTWHSSCLETVKDGQYIQTEYIISDSLILLSGSFYSDNSCSTPYAINSVLKASEIEYDGYKIVDTQQGYRARWYNSYILKNDAGEYLDDPFELPIGFYIEGQMLYDVTYDSETDEYIIDFNDFYTKQ